MKKYSTIILVFSLLAFFSCKNDSDDLEDPTNSSNSTQSDSESKLEKPKEYEEEVEVIFQENKENTSVENKLLQAVNLCNPTQKDMKNYLSPACDSKFFKVLPLISAKTIEDNFLVVCRSGVQGFPLRRILIFTKENEQYTTTNTFMADLIGMETSKVSEYKDLILQFMDTDENRFECRYKWREGRYAYDKVIKINGNKIKPQYLDSMKVVIGGEINRLKLSY